MAQIGIAWVLQSPVVTKPIVGAAKPHHSSDAAAAPDIELAHEETAALEKQYIGRAAGLFYAGALGLIRGQAPFPTWDVASARNEPSSTFARSEA